MFPYANLLWLQYIPLYMIKPNNVFITSAQTYFHHLVEVLEKNLLIPTCSMLLISIQINTYFKSNISNIGRY